MKNSGDLKGCRLIVRGTGKERSSKGASDVCFYFLTFLFAEIQRGEWKI